MKYYPTARAYTVRVYGWQQVGYIVRLDVDVYYGEGESDRSNITNGINQSYRILTLMYNPASLCNLNTRRRRRLLQFAAARVYNIITSSIRGNVRTLQVRVVYLIIYIYMCIIYIINNINAHTLYVQRSCTKSYNITIIIHPRHGPTV